MHTLSDYNFKGINAPWWVNLSVDTTGVLTVTNIVSGYSQQFAVGESFETKDEMLGIIVNSVLSFTETSLDSDNNVTRKFPILHHFIDPLGEIVLDYNKKTHLFETTHHKSGVPIGSYTLSDLFLRGPVIIDLDRDVHEMMMRLGML